MRLKGVPREPKYGKKRPQNLHIANPSLTRPAYAKPVTHQTGDPPFLDLKGEASKAVSPYTGSPEDTELTVSAALPLFPLKIRLKNHLNFCSTFFHFWAQHGPKMESKIRSKIRFLSIFLQCSFRMCLGIDFTSLLRGSDPQKYQFSHGKTMIFTKSTFSNKLKKLSILAHFGGSKTDKNR